MEILRKNGGKIPEGYAGAFEEWLGKRKGLHAASLHEIDDGDNTDAGIFVLAKDATPEQVGMAMRWGLLPLPSAGD